MNQMDSSESKEHIPRLIRFLDEINYRHTPPPPPCVEFRKTLHDWFEHVLGPITSWTAAMLNRLEDLTCALCERYFSCADVEMKFLHGRLAAIIIFLDDSIDDPEVYDGIEDFMRRVYVGEAHKAGTVVSLYHACIKELCDTYDGDAVLRDLAVASWLAFLDACLLERRLLTFNEEIRACPYDTGYEQILERRNSTGGTIVGSETIPDEAEVKLSGIGEAFAAAIFKASRRQKLPLTRFVKALPDMVYYICVVNDLLSFYKEQLAGETANMISLQHKSWKRLIGAREPMSESEWTLQETFGRICDETRDAALRVDKLLRMEACEKIEKGELKCVDVGLDVEDVAIARQWREFRHGYISWHLENPRYKLEFMDLSRYE